MISVAIFTLNEEINLPRCLHSLKSCDDVVVVDSFSSDGTQAIARGAGARVFEHAFTGFGDQRQWALETIPFKHPWVLILDADERITPALWHEMKSKVENEVEGIVAYRLKRQFFWEGKWLRHANLYPSWVVRLVRIGRVRYVNRGHAETQEVMGNIGSLTEDLIDENLNGLEAWRERQERYAKAEAQYEVGVNDRTRLSECFSEDPLVRQAAWKGMARWMPPMIRASVFFLYAYGLRLGFLDGWTGLRFCVEKAHFQARIAMRVRELRHEI